jgi:ParB/RepB/Spo0J family partition protein
MELRDLSINEIRVGYHPRKVFRGKEKLREKIQREGFNEPLKVRPEKDCFVLIDGKKRLSVLKELGHETCPCIIEEIDERNAAHQSYLLNAGDYRENLNPIEVSLHIKEMREKFGFSVQDLVNLGYATDDQTIYNKLSLLTLPQKVQDKIAEGEVSPTIGYELARNLSRSEDKDFLMRSFEELCANRDLTVSRFKRQMKDLIDSIGPKNDKDKPVLEIPEGDIPGVFFKDSSDMSELADESVHLIVTSPPYGVGMEYEEGVSFDDHLQMLKKVLGECVRVLCPGRKICINVGDITTFGTRNEGKPEIQLIGHFYQDILRKHGVRLVDRIIWKKCHKGKRDFNWFTNPQVSYHKKVRHTTYRILNNTEYIFVFEKDGDAKLPYGPEISKEEWKEWVDGVWEIPPVRGENGHPAPFPEELVTRLIKLFSFEGEIVLDCFGGTMTTVKVAKELGRVGIGYEKDEKYKSTIMKKLGVKEEDLKKEEKKEVGVQLTDEERRDAIRALTTDLVPQILAETTGKGETIRRLSVCLKPGLSREDVVLDTVPVEDDLPPTSPNTAPQVSKADDYEDAGKLCNGESSAGTQGSIPALNDNGNISPHLNKVILGDCLSQLKDLPDGSVDLITTDPPYGLKFMGKDWDKAVPSADIWKECLRVLKPGAFAFVMCAPRQDCQSRMTLNLEKAGFETSFTPLYWAFASGFPKALNIGKAMDKKVGAERQIIMRNPNSREKCTKSSTLYESGTVGKTAYVTEPATEKTREFEGAYGGFQPKPAVEVIIVAMKPMDQKTYAAQALKNGKGITWLDDCRIPYANNADKSLYDKRCSVNGVYETGLTWGGKKILDMPKAGARTADFFGDVGDGKNLQRTASGKGRFSANLLVSDDILDDGKEHISPKPYKRSTDSSEKSSFGFGTDRGEEAISYGDKGGYSRFFSLDAWADKNLPFLLVPKASKKEKNSGLEGFEEKTVSDGSKKAIDNPFQRGATPKKNTHPTVKPVKLMAYLITMGSREGDVVLDCFAGSGSTCLAAKMLNRKFIGMELNPEYQKIAEERLGQPALAMAA